MIGRILLILFVLLILLIFFVPYGVDAGYEQGLAFLRIKAGPLHLQLWPKKPPTERQLARKRKKQAKAEAKKKAAEAKKESENKAKSADSAPQGTHETITVKEKTKWDLDMILALVKMGMHAIRRFFRSFTIDFFKLHYTLAGNDPYNVAMQYGQACAAVEELPALCGRVIRVRRSDIALSCDFVENKPAIQVRLVLTVQLFKLVHMAAAFLVEYIAWKIKSRREKKAAASMERKDDNGRQPDQ